MSAAVIEAGRVIIEAASSCISQRRQARALAAGGIDGIGVIAAINVHLGMRSALELGVGTQFEWEMNLH